MNRYKRTLIVVFIVFVLINLIFIVSIHSSGYSINNMNSYYTNNENTDHSILVLVPHEDDELLVAGDVIRNSVIRGMDVYIVFTTNGDYEGSDTAAKRFDEAIAAMDLLGVPEENLIFLGYGDQWMDSHMHIYHAPSKEVFTSHSGRTNTYGTNNHLDFRTRVSGESSLYTRSNFKKDIRDVILLYRPNEIYAVDFDFHPDHRATSLLFDEAMHEVLRDNDDYEPRIYKGFAYSTEWFAHKDFYQLNLESTLKPVQKLSDNSTIELDNPNFLWAERVRFMVPNDMLSYSLHSNLLYDSLNAYPSQNAISHAEQTINSDQVFWERRSDSFSYKAHVTSTSGETSYVNDFKLFDTDDITIKEVQFNTPMWIPSATDTSKTIRYDFDTPVTIGSLAMYDNVSLTDNIISCEVTFSDGSMLPIGSLHPNGSSTDIYFPEKEDISYIEFSITSYEGENPGLSEWEVFPPINPSIEFIKLMLDNEQQTFIYQYLSPDNEDITVDVYHYPQGKEVQPVYHMLLTDDSGTSQVISDNNIHLEASFLPKKYRLRVELVSNPEIYDEVELISYNYYSGLRIKTIQNYERIYEKINIFMLRVKNKLLKTIFN